VDEWGGLKEKKRPQNGFRRASKGQDRNAGVSKQRGGENWGPGGGSRQNESVVLDKKEKGTFLKERRGRGGPFFEKNCSTVTEKEFWFVPSVWLGGGGRVSPNAPTCI